MSVLGQEASEASGLPSLAVSFNFTQPSCRLAALLLIWPREALDKERRER